MPTNQALRKSMERHKAIVAIIAFGLLATSACGGGNEPSPEWSVLAPAQKTAVYWYVECVNSRFPLDANRWAFVSKETVAKKLSDGSLDFDGMRKTYRSLGCGTLGSE